MIGYGLVEITKDENWIKDHLSEILYQGQKVSFYIDDRRLCYPGILDTFYHNASFQIPSAEALKQKPYQRKNNSITATFTVTFPLKRDRKLKCALEQFQYYIFMPSKATEIFSRCPKGRPPFKYVLIPNNVLKDAIIAPNVNVGGRRHQHRTKTRRGKRKTIKQR
jgi:hypothetical protein